MKELDAVRAWREAIALGEYDRAIHILTECCENQGVNHALVGPIQSLIDTTLNWARGRSIKSKSEVQTRSRCSFCSCDQSRDRTVIAGPGVFICEKCVALCSKLLEAAKGVPRSPSPTA